MIFQLPDLSAFLGQVGSRGQDLFIPQAILYRRGQLGQHGLMGDHGQVHLQKIFPRISQFLNEVERVEDGQEYVALTEHIRQVELAEFIPVIGDGHAVFLPGPGQLMAPGFIHEAQADEYIRARFIVQLVDTALAKEGRAGDGKGDGVCNAGLSPAVTAGDNGGIAKGQLRGVLVGLESGDGHAGDLELFNFFQNRNSLLSVLCQAAAGWGADSS